MEGGDAAAAAAAALAPIFAPERALDTYIRDNVEVVRQSHFPGAVTCVLCNADIKLGNCSPQNFEKHLYSVHAGHLPMKYANKATLYWQQLARKSTKPETVDLTVATSAKRGAVRAAVLSGDELKRVLCTYLLADRRSFSSLESPGFRFLLRALNADLDIPSRRTLVRYIKSMSAEKVADLTRRVADGFGVALTCDYWSFDAKGFLGVTGSWIDKDLVMHTETLLMDFQDHAHTRAALAAGLRLAINSVGLRPRDIISITTDNGSNMVNAPVDLASSEPTAWQHCIHGIRCFGHNLNLVWDAVMADEAAAVVRAVRTVVMAYSSSAARRRVLEAACLTHGIPSRRLVFPVATRWWSEAAMLRRLLQLWPAVATIPVDALSLPAEKQAPYATARSFVVDRLDILRWLVGVAVEWEKWQVVLSASDSSHASWYCDAYVAILAPVAASMEQQHMAGGRPAIARLCAVMRAELRARFIESDPAREALRVFGAARMLDPATHPRWLRFNTEQRRAAGGVVLDMARQLKATTTVVPAAVPAVDDFGNPVAQDPLAVALSTMLINVKAAAHAGQSWQQLYGPHLATSGPSTDARIIARVAVRLFSVMAESTASERLFSFAGQVVKGRPQLRPGTISTLVFVGHNLMHALQYHDVPRPPPKTLRLTPGVGAAAAALPPPAEAVPPVALPAAAAAAAVAAVAPPPPPPPVPPVPAAAAAAAAAAPPRADEEDGSEPAVLDAAVQAALVRAAAVVEANLDDYAAAQDDMLNDHALEAGPGGVVPAHDGSALDGMDDGED